MTQDRITRVAFYFAAHQDDWQLFMNPPAFADVLDETCRCVFVHVTAGDAGLGLGSGGRKHPLYLARENGAEAAIRFMADANERYPDVPDEKSVTLNGRALRRIGYRNTGAYFLRLPDGSPSGDGYATTGLQSLKCLADGAIDRLTAIDNSTVYSSWADFCATLRALIEHESTPGAAIDLHVPEIDPRLNPGDHADHMMTARAVRDAATTLTARWYFHIGYDSGGRPENLSPTDRDRKCAIYAVTLAGVLALDHQVFWQHYDDMFIGRHYGRIE